MRIAMLICSAIDLVTANLAVSVAIPGSGVNNISVPLAANSSGPATHYGCYWAGLTEAEYDSLAALFPGLPVPVTGRVIGDGAVVSWSAFLTANSLTMVQSGPPRG